MDRERWGRLQDIFLAARQLQGAARQRHLAAACGDDEALREEVLSLLNADGRSGEVDDMVSSWLAPLADLPEQPSLAGTRLGPYVVAEEIGRGGMACVYRAERDDGQFTQTVAIKVLLRHHGDLAQRFLYERQVLARLDHPSIARLIDGGALADGSPYLVMEHVVGSPIDRWVDERRPGVRDTVRLFLQVCDAVQFAHRNLVIHRDLKPGNIMVTDDGHVRLLDFGIAKLLADEGPGLTRPFASILTPEYASPEQVQGGAVTTATDVYALGLVLHRLLCGVPAQPARNLTDAEIRRRVTEEALTAPSRAVADPRRARELRGDLDVIVARAAAKDPERRYGSPLEFADDLRRWLDGRPVHARPDGPGYRLRKFVRRHRAGVAAGSLAVLALLVGLGSTLWQARAAARERDVARVAAEQSAEVTRFMVGLFEAADPLVVGKDTLSARQVLDSGRRRLATDLAEQPKVRAALLMAMGESYLNLGLLDRADSLLNEAFALTVATAADDSLALAAALEGLARSDEASGRPAAAADRYGQVLGIRLRRLGPRHPQTATTWNNLGSAMMGLGRADSAVVCLAAALAVRQSAPGTAPLELAVVQGNLAAASGRLGQWSRSDSLFAAADQVYLDAGLDNHLERANLLGNWGVMLLRSGDAEGAATRVAAAVAAWRQVVGGDHPKVGIQENNLAAILERQGRDEEAEPHYREALRIKRLAMGSDHPSTASTLNNLALLVQRRGQLAAAEAMLLESLGIRERSLPPDHPDLARAWHNLARLFHDSGRNADAEANYRLALDLRARVQGDRDQETVGTAQSLAALLLDAGRFAEARELETRFGLTRSPEAPAPH